MTTFSDSSPTRHIDSKLRVFTNFKPQVQYLLRLLDSWLWSSLEGQLINGKSADTWKLG